mgnify:CR=1 FL=1
MAEPSAVTSIEGGGAPHYAVVVCSGTFGVPGSWTLHLADEDGVMSDALVKWDPSPLPIQLEARYDALALFGYAVVTGGVEAWEWHERDGEGGTYFVGTTPIRPLSDEERVSAAGPALERLHT